MGQNASVPREESDRRRSTWRPSSALLSTRHTVGMSYSRRDPSPREEEGWRHMAARNNGIDNGLARDIGGGLSQPHESTLLTGLDSSQESGPSTTTITAQCIPERQSLLSRARSRLIPSRNVDDGRRNYNPARSSHNATIPRTRRLLSFSGSASRTRRSGIVERRNGLASISRPIPFLPQRWPSEGEPESGPAEALRSLERPASPVRSTQPQHNIIRRSARLSRFRESLSMRFQDTFSTSSSSRPADVLLSPTLLTHDDSPNPDLSAISRESIHQTTSLPRRVLLMGQRAQQGFNLPALPPTPTLAMNGDLGSNPHIQPSPRPRSAYARTISSSLNRLRLPTGEVSRTPSLNGRQPTRLRRGEDQAAMLSRLLRVAAAATAQSLVGSTDRLYEARDVAHDGVGGGFEGFIHALENGGLAEDLRSGGSGLGSRTGSVSSEGGLAPLNFFRMFRFATPTESGNQESGSVTPVEHRQGQDTRRARESTADGDGGADDGVDGRMVPIIIVGIRSVPPHGGPEGNGDDVAPPILDALTHIPAPLDVDGEPGSGSLRSEGGVSRAYSQRRTASMGPINHFPAHHNSQQHQRTQDIGLQQGGPTLVHSANNSSSLSETPPGPHPPPSTPADPGLSAYSSGTTTPIHRPSFSSAALRSNLPPSQSQARRSSAAGLDPNTENHSEPNTARPRRLSDSDFSRHRTFGSGAPRRNGVVEPDRRAPEGTRSWIIYVLGGSYPENHPILTTPSLFTDSPSYEDMLMLSSIIGTAKAPVASSQEIASAHGLFKIRATDTTLMADGVNESTQFAIAPDERCSVCLVEYAVGEDIRRLKRCQHMYHRECIDEWLTTCRNSCPMCRRRAVGDDPNDAESVMPGAPTPSPGVS